MPTSPDADSRSAKLKTSFQNLSSAAQMLNSASGAFSDAIVVLDEALNQLNPGVTCWITFDRWALDEDRPWDTYEERLGYTKLSGRWGLSLRTATVNSQTGEEEFHDSWLFNDGPRELRIKAIGRVPDLIEALAKQAAQTAKKVIERAELAKELANSISFASHKSNALSERVANALAADAAKQRETINHTNPFADTTKGNQR